MATRPEPIAKSTVLQCKHTDKDRELNEENVRRMDIFFSNIEYPRAVYAIVTFTKEHACIMPLAAAQEITSNLAEAISTCEYTPYTYVRPTKPLATLRVLSDFEYRTHWLANYFKTSIEEIKNFISFNPAEHSIQRCPIDWESPQMPLGNGFYAHEDVINPPS